MPDKFEDGKKTDRLSDGIQVIPMTDYPSFENEDCPVDDPSTNFEEDDFEEEDFRLYLSDSEEEVEADKNSGNCP